MNNITFDRDDKPIIAKGWAILYFSAPWCQPCKIMKPDMERIKPEEAIVYLVDVDNEKCARYAYDMEVEGIPTILFMLNGRIKHRKHGYTPISDVFAELRYQQSLEIASGQK